MRELVIYSAMPDSLIIMLYIMSFKQKSNENIYSHLMLGLEILGLFCIWFRELYTMLYVIKLVRMKGIGIS